jgi:hypothetical protein
MPVRQTFLRMHGDAGVYLYRLKLSNLHHPGRPAGEIAKVSFWEIQLSKVTEQLLQRNITSDFHKIFLILFVKVLRL